MKAIINKSLNQKVKSISVITLLAFLLAFFHHSQHISKPHTEQSSVGDYQDCHLCQQGVDSAPKPLSLTAVVKGTFSRVNLLFITYIGIKQAFITPHLRAPPFFL